MKAPPGGVLDRLAGAPISWGVCEVPGWGVMLPRERVLSEMHGLGLKASELGALGYLGDDPAEIRALLSSFSLGCVGGFVPVALHDPGVREQARARRRAGGPTAAGGGRHLFRDRGRRGRRHGRRHSSSTPANGTTSPRVWAWWNGVCAAHGLTQVLHPHVGTLVERAEHVDQVLRRSDVQFCLDTGHFSIGGADPVAFAADHAAGWAWST